MEHIINPENLDERSVFSNEEAIVEDSYYLFTFGYQHKLTDRYCQTHLFHQRFHTQPILLIVSTEIINPWHPAREIGTALGQTISRELAHAESQSLIIRFEASLKAANQFVAKHAQQLTSPINCSVALLLGNEVHFSGIGDGAITLGRNNQVSHIAPQQPTGQTFSVVTSGDLQDNDWLLVGTSKSTDAARAAIAFAEEIQLEDIKTGHQDLNTGEPWSGALIRYAPENPLERTIYFDTPNQQKSVLKLDVLRDRVGNLIHALKPVIAFMHRLAVTTGRTLKKFWKRIPEPRFMRAWPILVKRLITAALILLVIFWIGLALWHRHQASQIPVANKPVNPLVQALNLNDTDLSTYLVEHFALSNYQSMSGSEKSDFGSRLERAHINPIGLSSTVATLANPGVAIDRLGDTAYILDSTGQVWLLKGTSIQAVTQGQLIAHPVSLAAVKEDKLVVSDQNGNIWLINPTTGSTSSLSLPKEIQTGVKLVQNFENNLYIYALSTGNFYRVTGFTNDISKAALYINKETLPLQGVVDFAVDGQVIAIDTTGKLQDFSRNQLGKFSAVVPVGLSNSLFRLDGQADNPQLVVAAARELLIYPIANPTQPSVDFILSDSKLTDLAVSSNSVWLLIDRAVYQITL